MKKIFLSVIIIIQSVVGFSQIDRTKPPKADEPKALELGKMESFVLDNGLKIILAQSKDYPKFSMSINIQLPPFTEEKNLECKKILGKAYTEKLSEKYQQGEIDSITKFYGGMLAVNSLGGHIKGMKRDVDQLLDMYSDLLINPIIKKELITKEAEAYKKNQAKKSKNNNKKSKNPSSISITGQLMDSLIYGQSKKVIKEEHLLNYDTLNVSDINQYKLDKIVANNTLIVVVGDFTTKECKSLMNKHFGHWGTGKPFIRAIKTEAGKPAIKNRSIVVIDNPIAVQSNISFYWGMGDAFQYFEKETELNVLNELFGGSSLSYLFKNLREDKGLCYFIRSSIGTSGAGGNASISTSVKNDQTALAIENIILEMIRIRNEEVSEHDLQIAKNSMIGEFSRSLSIISPIYYISFAMAKEAYNLPDDYLQTRIPKMYNVSTKDILEMAQKYIDPFKCLIIVKGKSSELKGTLEKFGNVTYLDKDGKKIEE